MSGKPTYLDLIDEVLIEQYPQLGHRRSSPEVHPMADGPHWPPRFGGESYFFGVHNPDRTTSFEPYGRWLANFFGRAHRSDDPGLRGENRRAWKAGAD